MATIADLLSVLEHQAYALQGRHADDTVKGHEAGWMAVASATLRALSNLPLGGRRDRVDAGPVAVLKPLADGPYKPPAGVVPAQRLLQIGQTMGAIADVLAATTRFGPRPGLVGAEAVKLQASLLASVHLVAGWSRSVLADQIRPNSRSAIRAELGDLAVVTEPYALIPPSQRVSLIEDLRIRTRTAPGLEGAFAAWADEARPVLTERHCISGWAMQAIAGDLALISHIARRAVEQARTNGTVAPERADEASAALVRSVTAWRAAAAWPPNIRLGGISSDLREAVRELHEACSTEPLPGLATTRHLLDIAVPIGTLHAQRMEKLVLGHELWVHGPSLGPAAGEAYGWIREPWWSSQGIGLAHAARFGNEAILQGAAQTQCLDSPGRRHEIRVVWPPEVVAPPAAPAVAVDPSGRGARVGPTSSRGVVGFG